MKDLRNRTLTGLFWTLTSQVGQQLLSFVVSVVLTRLLMPNDFGLLGKVMVFVGFARLLGDFGFGAALIQDEAADQEKASSVFWLNLAFGVALTALLWLAAPVVASFYGDGALISLLRLLSFSVTLTAITTTQRALLRKVLDFRSIALADNLAALGSGAAAIALALAGQGVRAIALQSLIAAAVASVVLWARSAFRPSFCFRASAVRELWRYSGNSVGGSILNYWNRNLDNLLIGKFFGAAPLGIYQRAYGLMLLPLNQLTYVTGLVMFPTMSLVQLDHARVKRIYLRALAGIALLSAPTMLGLFVTAEPFVLVVFGKRWAEVIPILRVLALVGLMQSLNSTVGWIYNSQGRTDWQFRFLLVGSALTYLAFAVGLRWGLLGIAIAYAIRVYATTYFTYLIPGKLIGMHVREAARAVVGPLICVIAMAVLVSGLDHLLFRGTWLPMRLGALVAVGSLAYLMMVRSFHIAAYADVLQLVREQWEQRNAKLAGG